jgi:hypothetical protein
MAMGPFSTSHQMIGTPLPSRHPRHIQVVTIDLAPQSTHRLDTLRQISRLTTRWSRPGQLRFGLI